MLQHRLLYTSKKIWILSILSNGRLHLFNDDSDGLIPTRPGVSCLKPCSSTVANVESNFHLPRRNPTAVTLNVGRPVDVCVDAVVNDSINGCGITALTTVESEIPSVAAGCAAPNTNNTHVYHTQEGPRLQLDEITCLYF